MGSKIRQFLCDLFGSRLMLRLEEDLLRLRLDFETRLQDKDRIIADLRAEKQALFVKANLYEMTLMPHASRAGADLVKSQKPLKPSFFEEYATLPKIETSWQRMQKEHDAQNARELAEEAAAKAETASV